MAGDYRTRGRNRRGHRPNYDPLYDGAKALADELYAGACAIRDVIAPARPTDAVEVDEKNVYAILERVAIRLSPEFWDDPDAIDDLFRLRGQFAPAAPRDYLKTISTAVRKSRAALPDVGITPADPRYEPMLERMKRG